MIGTPDTDLDQYARTRTPMVAASVSRWQYRMGTANSTVPRAPRRGGA